jgi:hypothetical protein
LETLFCKILDTEIKKLLQESLKQFVGQSLEAFMKFLAEKILKGKVIQFAHRTLDGMVISVLLIVYLHFLVQKILQKRT